MSRERLSRAFSLQAVPGYAFWGAVCWGFWFAAQKIWLSMQIAY